MITVHLVLTSYTIPVVTLIPILISIYFSITNSSIHSSISQPQQCKIELRERDFGGENGASSYRVARVFLSTMKTRRWSHRNLRGILMPWHVRDRVAVFQNRSSDIAPTSFGY